MLLPPKMGRVGRSIQAELILSRGAAEEEEEEEDDDTNIEDDPALKEQTQHKLEAELETEQASITCQARVAGTSCCFGQ